MEKKYKPSRPEGLISPNDEASTLLQAEGVLGPFSSGSQFHRISQGTPIHSLIAASTSIQSFQMDAITHTGSAYSDGLLLTADNEEIVLSLSPQTFKVLIMLITIATEQLPRNDQITPEAILKTRTIRITLYDYMNACRISDKKSARDQLNKAIKALYGLSLKWDEAKWRKPDGKARKVKESLKIETRILESIATREGGTPVKNGAAEVQLAYGLAEYLAGAYIMPYPSTLLTINTHTNPYSIQLGWKLCALHNMNYGTSRQNRTTVETLLKAAKGIPRYQDIAHKGQIYRLIIERFDRDMRALVEAGVLSSYSYTDDKGRTISPEELGGLSYLEFSALNVCYVIDGYPSQAPRLEAKQKRITAATNRARRAAKKKQEAEASEDTETERERD